jgi:hypothetical protein
LGTLDARLAHPDEIPATAPVAAADHAMYARKRAGRGGFSFSAAALTG